MTNFAIGAAMKFLLPTEDCELLLSFEQNSNLAEVAQAVGKDVSVASRHLKKIAEKMNVLEKHHGRWRLTAQGHLFNSWTKEAIISQKITLGFPSRLTIAATTEFARIVLLPNTKA